MSFKSTEHEFEMGNDIVKITEFPFYPGESTHIEYNPYGQFEDVSLMGNPEKEQTLFFRTDESLCWVKSDYTLFEKLKEAIKKYEKMWDLNKTEPIICVDCETEIPEGESFIIHEGAHHITCYNTSLETKIEE